MSPLLRTTLAAAAVQTAVLFAGPALAYGEAAPMSVIGIEALAPVTSLNASSTDVAPSALPAQAQAAEAAPIATLQRWMAALRQRLSAEIELALR